MKNYIKGIITGIIIGAVICSIPALADEFDELCNLVRISVNGVDQIQWGEDIELGGGTYAPSSILYHGTTYLPMRKLGELSGNKIYWNGDSRTVGMTGAQKDIKVIAEKPDKNGNVWEYYTFKDDNDYCYLGVKDEARGYERVYRLLDTSVKVADDGIYFMSRSDSYELPSRFAFKTQLKKISYENDADTQDGEIYFTDETSSNYAVFDGEYVFYTRAIGSMNEGRDALIAYNIDTNEKKECDDNEPRSDIFNLELKDSNSEKTVFSYDIWRYGKIAASYEVSFDKNTDTFSEPTKIERSITEETE